MKLIGIGGAHVDRRGYLIGDYVPGASNPGTMREDIGGGVLNALRNAVQRSVQCTLVSIRGGDSAGDQVANAITAAGITDMSATFLDRVTPSYTALLDRNGDLIAGFADMGLYDLAFPKQLRRSSLRDAIGVHEAVLCDANVPASGLESIAEMSGGKPIYAIAISPAKVMRLRGVLSRLSCVFMNRRESSTLANRPESSLGEIVESLRAQSLRAGVITAGNEALTLFDGSTIYTLDPPGPAHVADVTGAGDALAGATIAAVLSGKPLTEAIREGVAASLLAIECPYAVPRLDNAAFAAKLALVPNARPMA